MADRPRRHAPLLRLSSPHGSAAVPGSAVTARVMPSVLLTMEVRVEVLR